MAFMFPCKTPKFQLKAEGDLFYLPPLPLQSVDLFGDGKGMVFLLLPGGPAAPQWTVEEKFREQDEKKHY